MNYGQHARSFLIANTHGRCVGFRIEALYQVILPQKLYLLPASKTFIDGFFVLNDQPVFMVNISKRMGDISTEPEDVTQKRNVILKTSLCLCAIQVMSVPEVFDLSSFPAQAAPSPFVCVTHCPTQDVYVLNPDLLLESQ